MIKNVNPRVAMFSAMQLVPEILTNGGLAKIHKFLNLPLTVRVELLGPAPGDPSGISFTRNGSAISIPLKGGKLAETITVLQVIILDRKTKEIQLLDPAEFERLYYEHAAGDPEIKRLADFVLANFPEYIGKKVLALSGSFGDLVLETAVDVAIHLLTEAKNLDLSSHDLKDRTTFLPPGPTSGDAGEASLYNRQP